MPRLGTVALICWCNSYLTNFILNLITNNQNHCVEQRKKRTKRHREEQRLYLQLSEAMECLEHICTEGCTSVGPYDMEPGQKRGPCSKFGTCQGLQHLFQHFATCKRRVNGGCSRCKRMWQLLRLHSSMCDQSDSCRVPLCRYKFYFFFSNLTFNLL